MDTCTDYKMSFLQNTENSKSFLEKFLKTTWHIGVFDSNIFELLISELTFKISFHVQI